MRGELVTNFSSRSPCAIAGAGNLSRAPPELLQLSREQVRMLQSILTERGIDPGPVDGILGSATRSAIQQFQQQRGLVADGYPTPELLSSLGIE